MRSSRIFIVLLLGFVIKQATPACLQAGIYLTGGICTVCPAGSQCTGNDGITACGAGYYSLSGASACTQCPAGFSCTSTSFPIKCGPGTFSTLGQGSCSNCASGSMCTAGATATCGTGLYQTAGTQEYCSTCPAGSSCTTTAASTCGSGLYSDAHASSCTSFGSTDYATGVQIHRTCPNGYYLDSGHTTCTVCAAGKYCVGTTTAATCPSNTVSPPASSSSSCITIPTSLIIQSGQNLASTMSVCLGGTYRADINTCTNCPSGSYCPDPTINSMTTCPAGSYTSATQKMFCTMCTQGNLCTGGSSNTAATSGYYSSNFQTQAQCTAGNYCPYNHIQFACPYGTYSTSNTATTCTDCPAGSSCTSSTITACSSGYSSATRQTSCNQSPAGTSLAGSLLYSALVACTLGQYSAAGSTCGACPAGSYCPTPDTQITSPTGFFAAASSTFPSMCPMGYSCTTSASTACSVGNFAIYGAGSCSAITNIDGYYQMSLTSYFKAIDTGKYLVSNAETACTTGKYCIYGTQITCPTGSDTAYMTSATGNFYCNDCPYGKACYSGPLTPNCLNNTRYSSSGLTDCFTCDDYRDCTYRSQYFLYDSASDMLPCPVGYFAVKGESSCRAIQRKNNVCLFGYYSLLNPLDAALFPEQQRIDCKMYDFYSGTNTVLKTGTQDCVLGTYTLKAFDSCLVSPPGFIAPGQNTADLTSTNYCPQGFYCQVDMDYTSSTYSVRTARCPFSTYAQASFTGGKSESETCIVCPPGSFCQGDSLAAACPTGYICERGNINPTVTCPPGFYYDTTKTDVTFYGRCTQCPLNSVCPALSTQTSKTACLAGYFCGVQTFDNAYYTAQPGKYIATSGGSEAACTAGNYCPQASSTPKQCPKGFYLTTTGMAGSEDCAACAPGMLCSSLGASAAPATSCTANKFCPEASQAERLCPAGTLTTSTGGVNEDSCTACAAGTACKVGQASPAAACTAGFYCLFRSYDPSERPCPAGTSSAATTLTAASGCTDCNTAGTYCPEGSTAPLPCEVGYSCPGTKAPRAPCPATTFSSTSASSCTSCTAGNICPGGYQEINPIPCPVGYYMGSGGSAGPCLSCPAGRLCASAGTSTPANCPDGYWSVGGAAVACVACPAGSFCAAGVITDCPQGSYCPLQSSAAVACEAGYFCPAKSPTHLLCPPGKYSAASASTCLDSTAGHFTKAGQSDVTMGTNQCAAGFFCEIGAKGSIHKPCAPGTYVDAGVNGPTSCLPCPAGSYCAGGSSTATKIACPAGYYCLSGSATPTKCSPGTFNANPGGTTAAACIACTAGNVCTQYGLSAPDNQCDAGYYCIQGASNSQPTVPAIGGMCGIGTFCLRGVATAANCPNGKFNVFKGCRKAADCLDCPFGFICNDASGTNLNCPAGSYCPGGTYTATKQLAQAGYFTIAGQGAQIPCIPGTFTSATEQTACTSCTAGSSCPSSSTSAPTACVAGKYCPTGTVTPYYCPQGTFRASTGATVVGDCTPCTAGSYCLTIGLTAVTASCAAGFYCTLGAFHAMPAYVSNVAGVSVFGPCPTGSYCVSPTTTAVQCLAGTYSPSTCNTQLSDCYSCTPGKYCDTAGLAAPANDCTAGYYCDTGATTATKAQCQAGYYCPTGSPKQIKCAGGQYQTAVGQSSCTACTAGNYCPVGASSLTPCVAGYYCLASTEDYKKYPCAPGSFSNTASLQIDTACTPCTAGSYCTNYGLTAVTGGCTAGYYCKAGNRFATPITSAEGGKCTSGQICPAGAATTTICPATYVCNAELMTASTVQCNHGFKCDTGLQYKNPEGVSATSDLCSAGGWCQLGVSTACVAGKYLPSKGAGTVGVSECLDCPYGKYCATANLAAPTGDCTTGYFCANGQTSATATACAAGYFCGTGSIQQTPCPAGYFKTTTTATTCDACTTGNYCLYSSTAGTPAQTTCPAGSQCNAGTLDRSVLCAAGNYQDTTGQTTCKACTGGNFCDRTGMIAQTQCPAGYYCAAGAQNGQANICQPGYFCPAGSTTPTACTAGFYCSDYGLSAPNGACLAGYYCLSGAKTGNPTDGTTGNICPEGYYCPNGLDKTACGIGKYNQLRGSEASSDCLDCPAGSVCTTSALPYPLTTCAAGSYCAPGAAAVSCQIGYMCPAGAVGQTLCMPGTYQDVAGQAVCKTCPAGSYCNYVGAITVATTCPAGYYCPSGTADYLSFPCPVGTFNSGTGLSDSSQCTSCTVGSYCLLKGLTAVSGTCTNGYECPVGSQLPSVDANMCPKNFYCAAGVKTACSASQYTYGTVIGASATTHCMNCLPGFLCPTHDTSIGNCPAGSYCVDGVQTTCPAGSYCPVNTEIPIPCPRGKYTSTTGASTCTDCPSGTYCDTIGTTTPATCVANLVCPLGSVRSVPCTYGKYAVANACNDCTAGSWCWISNTNNLIGVCNNGFICSGGSSSPTPFYAGSIKFGDANLQTYNGRAAMGCYTSTTAAGLTASNTPCPVGSYMPSVGATSCIACPPGYYCDVAGIYSLTTKSCTAGYACYGSATTAAPTDGTTGAICPINKYCPAGTNTAFSCADGAMALTTGKSLCDFCDVGFSCTLSAPHAACATNNVNCIIGTSFEPLCPKGTYINSGSCVSCPAGLFCIDGRSVAAPGDCSNGQCCTAGFLCTGGAADPRPGGKDCTAGYFCPEGATSLQSCPVNLYIFSSGARQVSDCTSCTEGFICTAGNAIPTPCSVGEYCPTGITGWLPCPNGTYSATPMNTIVHQCLSCPAGYLCNQTLAPTGITAYTGFNCTMGKYCLTRALAGVNCTYGTYNNYSGASSSADCKPCPSGFYCNNESITNGTNTSCIGGQKCGNGTSIPDLCPEGYYCNNVTGYLPKICPINYYCQPNSTYPKPCITGQMCPVGSGYPIMCVAGQISVTVNDIMTCQRCPAGTYSISGSNTTCAICEAGYVCLGGTTVQYPWSVQYHNGFQCPAGSYCPAGSSKATPCAAGTYNPLTLMNSSASCLLCKKNTFNPSTGQPACFPCGDSAQSDPGASICNCLGQNRAFLITDSSCRCKPGYEFLQDGVIQNDVNSKLDCQPIVFKRCTGSQIRSYDGSCKDISDCSGACKGGQGSRSPTLGVCQCNDVQQIDKLIPKATRDALPKMTINANGTIRVNQGNDTYNYNPTVLNPTDMTGFNSKYMTCPEGKSCAAKGIHFGKDGSVGASYGLTPRLASAYLGSTSTTRLLEEDVKRLLATTTSTEISNPVICVHEGDSAVFEVDGGGHYPVYQKDSLLNSNPNFDYGAFKALAESVAAQMSVGDQTPQYFGYTFTTAGRYFFTDSINTETTLVVSVTKGSEQCASENAFLQPRTSSSLSVFGLALSSSIMLEPDYVMLAIIICAFLLSLGMLLVLMKVVTEHMWKTKDAPQPLFRKAHKDFDVTDIKYLSSGARAIPALANAGAGPNSQLSMTNNQADISIDPSFIAEFSESLNGQKLEELDPFIIEKILKDYQAYKDYLKDELLTACEKQSKQIEDLNGAIEKLKFLLNERYEKLIALLKLDVDYTKLNNVKIKMEEEKEEGKKREKRIKPSDIKLAKSEEKRVTDVLKQIMAGKNEATVDDNSQGDDEAVEEKKPNKQKGIGNSTEEMEEKIKSEFESRLKLMSDLSDFEKNKMRDELSSEMINLETVLAAEREQQEISIRRLLQSKRRKAKGAKKEAEPIDLTRLTKEEKDLKEKVEKQLEDETRDHVREIEQRTINKIQKSKDKILKQLGVPSNLSEKEKDIILNNHKAELTQLLEAIKQEQDKQMDDLQRRLEKRKQAKVIEQIQKLKEENQVDVPVEEADNAEVVIPEEALKANIIEELNNEESAKVKELEEKHQEEKKKLTEAHEEEIKFKANELGDDLEIEVEKEIETRKAKIEERYQAKQQEVEDQRRKLKDRLLFSGGDKEASEKLMEEVRNKDELLKQFLEDQNKEQEFLLEEKIKRRKIAKEKKLLAFKNAQHDNSIELKLKQLKEKHDMQGQFETEKIKEIIRIAREQEPGAEMNEKYMLMFEKLWNDKEATELANLFGRQLAEKEGKLRAVYKKNVEQRLMEKQGVKEKYKQLNEDLENRKDKIAPEQYEARQKELRVEEENDLKESDIKESMNQKKEEFALRQDLEEKSATELGDLQEKLAQEKLATMKELFGLQREEEKAINNRIKDMKETLEREKDRKIKDIELDKKIALEKYENEIKERFNNYEDVIKKQRETEKLIKEKKGNIERMLEERKKQMAELKDKAQFTPEQEKQLLDKYQQDLKALESAMEAERNRQYAVMREKLSSKQSKRERESSYQKKKVAFMMGTVGKNVTLAQGTPEKASKGQPKSELDRCLLRWKKDMEDREKSQKTTTFETLQKYLENVGKFKEKGLEGIFLQGSQYAKYLLLMKAAKILQKKLEELHRIKANGALIDLKAALKIFSEDDTDRLKARPERIGGGFRCFDNDGNVLWELYKFLHSS